MSKLHKYPKWLGVSPIWIVIAGAIPILLAYFIKSKPLYYVSNVIGALAVIYIVLRQMLYPWAIQVIEWFEKRKTK